MADRDRQFERLLHLAREESAPSVDVAGNVIAILAGDHQPVTTISERFWMWLAAASSAVAVPAAILAVVTYGSWNDPLAQIFTEISWAMQ